MQFRKIRLTGFKSFVDPTELIIEPGLTGIVGPNGCGKSNLVEAIRWVMGETSAKQMRGGEMNDVIFGGTSNKPARNIAEVGVMMDNSARRAPVGFNDHLELEITRRIERDKGSAYRVNGKEVRARDVQLLFADASTGARSPGLVSQGRIGAIINAKPADRRMLLEEAAGIIGLHSRRHEAELRLRAAEGNLARLDDVVKTMDAQLQGLKRQGKQASRYRNLSDHIRRAEAILLHLRWQKAQAERAEVEARLREAERAVATLTTQVSEATTLAGKTQEALPGLRQAEAEAGAEFQHLTIAKTELDAEERRVVDAKAQAEQRLVQLDSDSAREAALAKDAGAALDRLGSEAAGLEEARAGEADGLAEAQKRLDAAFADAEEVETALNALSQAIAGDEARKTQQERQVANLEERLARLARQAGEIEEQRRRLIADSDIEGEAASLRDTLTAAESALAEARSAVEQAEAGVASTQAATAALQAGIARQQQVEREARTLRQQAEQTAGTLRAEIGGLRAVLTEKAGEKAPVLGQISARPGYEAALGAALGDDLEAALGGAAPRRWEELPPLEGAPALPDGVEPLSASVTAPPALARRLGQIGVVESEAQALALRPALKIGQRLVDRAGGLWRWDGFTVAAGAPSAAAARLRQKNRLLALEGELATAEAEQARVTALHAEAEKAVQAAQEQERASRAAEQT
ncbi:MAG: chromosome segregation protein SMC, partial [Alphaproteobacteria bacterium]|nr:chromosome segregation protein SMC [Alphaproteobacteria bacterium]